MNLPDRVNLDLRQRERDNDDAEEYFAMNRDSQIEEEVYRLEKKFDLDDFTEALSEAPTRLQLDLFIEAFKQDGSECVAILRDIRDAWIKRVATERIDNS